MTYDARRDPDYLALFKCWCEYERVAMHFNDLLIRLRSQALAAIGGFATIAGVLLKSAEIEPRVTWVAMAAVLGALAFFWLAIWILDFGYYSRLLMGAVRALLDLEGTSAGQIQLSTMIEKTVRPKGDPKDAAGSPLAVRFFYALVLGVLIVATVASWDIGRHSSALPPMPPYELVRPTSYTGQ